MNRSDRRQAEKRDKDQRKILFGQLDKIYKTCVDVTKAWDLKTVPLVVLKETIKQGSPKAESGNEYADIINKSFTDSLNILYSDMKKIAKSMGVEKVPLFEVQSWISTWKSVYSEAMRNNHK